MNRKVLSFTSLILCFLLLFSTVAFAADGEPEDEPSDPRYNIIISTSCGIDISGITAISTARLQANGSHSLSITMELQKLKSGSYSTVQTWTSSKTGTIIAMEESKLINIFATYRLKVTFTAGSETVVSYAYP